MTDGERFDLLDRQKDLILNGEVEIEEVQKEISKLKILRFKIDNRKENTVSNIDGIITFVDSKSDKKVDVDDVWLCSVVFRNNVYYAMPLIKITPMLLLNIDVETRKEIIKALWEQNRKGYEKEFEKLYKEELHAASIDEVRKESDDIISKQKDKISDLENQLAQSRIAIQSSAPAMTMPDTIELGSFDGETSVSLSSAPIPQPTGETICTAPAFPPTIPYSTKINTPGIPEMMVPDLKSASPKTITYRVERTGEDTIDSESFTETKYFVHISPDCKILVVRPNEYGTALCINHRIRLEGLGKLSPFVENKTLNAEFNERYGGMIIYL